MVRATGRVLCPHCCFYGIEGWFVVGMLAECSWECLLSPASARRVMARVTSACSSTERYCITASWAWARCCSKVTMSVRPLWVIATRLARRSCLSSRRLTRFRSTSWSSRRLVVETERPSSSATCLMVGSPSSSSSSRRVASWGSEKSKSPKVCKMLNTNSRTMPRRN